MRKRFESSKQPKLGYLVAIFIIRSWGGSIEFFMRLYASILLAYFATAENTLLRFKGGPAWIKNAR